MNFGATWIIWTYSNKFENKKKVKRPVGPASAHSTVAARSQDWPNCEACQAEGHTACWAGPNAMARGHARARTPGANGGEASGEVVHTRRREGPAGQDGKDGGSP
jgi:hypothetical protein